MRYVQKEKGYEEVRVRAAILKRFFKGLNSIGRVHDPQQMYIEDGIKISK